MGKKNRNVKVTEKVVQTLEYLQDRHDGLDERETIEYYRGVRKHLKSYIKMLKGKRGKKNRKKTESEPVPAAKSKKEKKAEVDSPPHEG